MSACGFSPSRCGRHVTRIECVSVREPLDQIDIRFYLDGRRVTDDAIIYDADGIELRLDLPVSRIGRLAWTCRPFPAAADPRRLGLPVVHLEVIPHAHSAKISGREPCRWCRQANLL
jgi:hypothetical protein